MGSFIYDTELGKVYGHTGFIPGFNSIFAYYPEYDIAAAIQINCDYATKQMGLIDYLTKIMEVVISEKWVSTK